MAFRAALPALGAALLFGASTPFAKLLLGDVPPMLLAGLLYLGSGVGLAIVLGFRHLFAVGAASRAVSPLARQDLPWLIGAILFGGVLGPVLLLIGLTRTSAASASLLLNVEGVLTAVLAWIVFKENAERRIVLGMAVIVLGGVLLSWEPAGQLVSTGALFVIGACLCWAIDNNLTRKVSSNDAMLIACVKGLVAGACNTTLALAADARLPAMDTLGASLLVGFVGYGLSLTLFVIGLRHLGTARTGAYFSVAPLFGVVVSLLIWPEAPGALFWLAAVLMGLGVWLHLSERHTHLHSHPPLVHSHSHTHDAHHQHQHDFPWHGTGAHVHRHRHDALAHSHSHYPDIHHQHPH